MNRRALRVATLSLVGLTAGGALVALGCQPAALAAVCSASVKGLDINRSAGLAQPAPGLAFTGVANIGVALVVGVSLLLAGPLAVVAVRRGRRPSGIVLTMGLALVTVTCLAAIGAHAAAASTAVAAAPRASGCTPTSSSATTPSTSAGGVAPSGGSGSGGSTGDPGTSDPGSTGSTGSSGNPASGDPGSSGSNPPAALPESPLPAVALLAGLGGGALVLRRRRA